MIYNFSGLKTKIKGIEEWLTKEFASLRTNRATPAVLDGIEVESYGSRMPINQVASVTTEGPKMLRISPWDTSMIKIIEKAIIDSGIGLSPAVDEKGVRVSFPELTSERRDGLIKIAKQKLEDARVSLRKERDASWEEIQAKEKQGGMSEDEKFRFKAEMQKLIDEGNKALDAMLERKEKEIKS